MLERIQETHIKMRLMSYQMQAKEEELGVKKTTSITGVGCLFGLTWLLGADDSFRNFLLTEAFSPKYIRTSLAMIINLVVIMFFEGVLRHKWQQRRVNRA